MANPEKKLVTQFTVLVRRASLQTERTHSNKNKRHLAGVILSSCKCTVKMGPCVTYGLIFNQTLCLQGIFGVTEKLLFPATYWWFDRSLVVSCSVAAKLAVVWQAKHISGWPWLPPGLREQKSLSEAFSSLWFFIFEFTFSHTLSLTCRCCFNMSNQLNTDSILCITENKLDQTMNHWGKW